MRRLEFDFQQPVDHPNRTAGWMLLVAGLALATEMAFSYDRLHHDEATMNREIRTTKLHLENSVGEINDKKFSEGDFEAGKQIVERLTLPWGGFFSGLESVGSENVAILSIEPDMKTGLLRIEGEARDYAAILTLIAQLRVTKPFSDVILLRHEIKRDDSQHPISFALSVHWTKLS